MPCCTWPSPESHRCGASSSAGLAYLSRRGRLERTPTGRAPRRHPRFPRPPTSGAPPLCGSFDVNTASAAFQPYCVKASGSLFQTREKSISVHSRSFAFIRVRLAFDSCPFATITRRSDARDRQTIRTSVVAYIRVLCHVATTGTTPTVNRLGGAQRQHPHTP